MTGVEAAVGTGRIRIIHANDAKGEIGSRLDRHEHLGQGHLGLGCFRHIMNDSRFREVPKILETPKEEDGIDMDLVNLEILRSLEGASRVPPRLVERTVEKAREAAGGQA